jgi:hypothetical protein
VGTSDFHKYNQLGTILSMDHGDWLSFYNMSVVSQFTE